MNLDNTTKDLTSIDASFTKDIEFEFKDFDAPGEKFTIKDTSGNIIAELEIGTKAAGYPLNINTPLDTSYVGGWDYSNLQVPPSQGKFGLGTIKLTDIKQDIVISATGSYLDLTKIVITPDIAQNEITTTEPRNYPTRDDTNLANQANKLLLTIDAALTQLNSARAWSWFCD
jgi:hypothetical protein